VTNPARRDSYLDTHVIVCRDLCAARMERGPSGVWGSVVETSRLVALPSAEAERRFPALPMSSPGIRV
jgi:hypothetical protein